MSSIRQPKIKVFNAVSDLSSKQYCFVKYNAAGDGVDVCGAGEKSMGVLQNAPAMGEPAEVALPGGGALLKLGEALNAGALLTPLANGSGEQCDAADEWCGAMLAQSGAIGDIVEVDVCAFYASKSDA